MAWLKTARIYIIMFNLKCTLGHMRPYIQFTLLYTVWLRWNSMTQEVDWFLQLTVKLHTQITIVLLFQRRTEI